MPTNETALPFVVPGSGLATVDEWQRTLRHISDVYTRGTTTHRNIIALAAHLPTLATLVEAGVRARVPNAETDAEHQARCGASPCPRCDAMIAVAMARRSGGDDAQDVTCPRCDGDGCDPDLWSGGRSGMAPDPCAMCAGNGRVAVTFFDLLDAHPAAGWFAATAPARAEAVTDA